MYYASSWQLLVLQRQIIFPFGPKYKQTNKQKTTTTTTATTTTTTKKQESMKTSLLSL